MKNQTKFYSFIIAFLFMLSFNNGYSQCDPHYNKMLTSKTEWDITVEDNEEVKIAINFGNYEEPNTNYVFKTTAKAFTVKQSGKLCGLCVPRDADVYFNQISELFPEIYNVKIGSGGIKIFYIQLDGEEDLELAFEIIETVHRQK